MSPRQAVDLDDDVLYGVYNHIGIWDLVKLRLISKRWDVTIREHPHYWKKLDVKIRTPGAVEFLLARLAASRHRPIDVRVLFPKDDEKADVAQLPEHYRVTYHAVTSHIDHIASLSLRGPAHHHPFIFSVIRQAAPLLHTLDIGFALPNAATNLQRTEFLASLTLPRELLSGVSHILRTVTLWNVVLNGQTYPCFANVTKASMIYTPYASIKLPHPPGLFPRATALEVGGSSLLAVEDGGPGADGSWNAIESYTLHNRAVWWHVNSLGGRGRSVTYYDWDLNVLHNVHQRLVGPLNLVVDATRGHSLAVEFESTINGCKRCFRSQVGAWTAADVPDPLGITYDQPNTFSYSPLMERVVYFSCSPPLLDHLAHRFAPMTALETLAVTVYDHDAVSFFLGYLCGVRDNIAQDVKVVCPRLRSLAIRWDTAKLPISPRDTAREIVEQLDFPASLSVTFEGVGIQASPVLAM